MKIFIFQLLIIQIISGSDIKYGDEQITAMLKEYFLSNKSSPLLLGHQFYTDNDENIFQIEIKTKTQNVNSALLFGFKELETCFRIGSFLCNNRLLWNVERYDGYNITYICCNSYMYCNRYSNWYFNVKV